MLCLDSLDDSLALCVEVVDTRGLLGVYLLYIVQSEHFAI